MPFVGAVPSDTTATSTSATPTAAGQSSTMPAIVAAVFGILVVTLLAAVSAIVIILITLRRKKKTKEVTIQSVHYTHSDTEQNHKDLSNPLYLGMELHLRCSYTLLTL